MALRRDGVPFGILDGGIGSYLGGDSGAGGFAGDALWSSRLLLSDPAAVKRCHKDYLEVPQIWTMLARVAESDRDRDRYLTSVCVCSLARSVCPNRPLGEEKRAHLGARRGRSW